MNGHYKPCKAGKVPQNCSLLVCRPAIAFYHKINARSGVSKATSALAVVWDKTAYHRIRHDELLHPCDWQPLLKWQGIAYFRMHRSRRPDERVARKQNRKHLMSEFLFDWRKTAQFFDTNASA